ncbi:MAG: M3 family oligoendopeptidase [Methylobacteriaceae bacterium]|nr:M3 family oligoendopeptidase [Methylobacteriaceae bacterium]
MAQRIARKTGPKAAGDSGAELPRWNLTDLYPGRDSAEFKRDMEFMAGEAKAFAEQYRGRIVALAAEENANQALFDAIRRFEAIDDVAVRLVSYAGLLYSEDSNNPEYGRFYGDTQEKLTAASSDLLFFTLELNRIDDAVINALVSAKPLSTYKPWLRDIRREKPYQLEDKLEQLFLEKSIPGEAAWNRLFDETISSLRFVIQGETVSIEPALNKLMDSRENVRKEAAGVVGDVLSAHMPVFTLTMNALAKEKEISDRWRGFRDVADSRHLANRVEGEVVNALVEAVRGAYPRLSHRYYAMKARWFGKDKLEHWDRNAPLPKVKQPDIPWEEARDTVLLAYGEFSPKMAMIAKRFFDEHWIDAPVRPGKSPGAFAHPTTPSVHPYVLVNYMGKPRDVMTLAHELGHGVHQVLAGKQGPLMSATPLTLAETASVFGEMLTFRKLLDGMTDKAQRKAFMASKVEDMINTVVRQIAFYCFERKIHEARRQGELTAETIGKFWMEVQSESLGPAIHLGPGYENFWGYVSHFFHAPFYVYAYAFGDCLVNSLYGVYQDKPKGFSDKYLALLSAGGSKPYNELLKPFGLNPKDPAFWSIGLSMIDRLIDELERSDSPE